MDLFEFILIITSVIYAMGVAQILSGISRLAQADTGVRWFFPHTMWLVILFIYIFLVWWSAWEFRDLEWNFPAYLYMVIAPTLTYFACSLLVPQKTDGADVNLEEHFFHIRRPFLGSLALATVAAVLDGSVLKDEPLWFPGRIGHVLLIATMLLGLCTSNKRVHASVAVLVMLALMYIAVSRLWNPR